MSTNYSLESAREEDFPAVRALIHSARLNPTGLDWRRFLVARNSSGEVIACGQIKPHADGSRELASIAVTPAWQGKGVASGIITRLLEQHPGVVYLTCRAELGAFYQRFGFEPAEPPLPPYFRRLVIISRWLLRLGLLKTRVLIMRRN